MTMPQKARELNLFLAQRAEVERLKGDTNGVPVEPMADDDSISDLTHIGPLPTGDQ